jgi:predicted ester cyclase
MRISSLAAAALLLVATTASATADDKAVVTAFYTQLLSAPNTADIDERVSKVVIDNWVSIPTPRGGKGAAGLVKSLKGFGAAIPDLKWSVKEILQDGNRYTVRSIATGTPTKTFFGVEPSGKSFEIMTIDIHTVENGRITKSYHVEEWAKAVQQLSAK